MVFCCTKLLFSRHSESDRTLISSRTSLSECLTKEHSKDIYRITGMCLRISGVDTWLWFIEVVIRKGLLLLHIANDGWFVLGHCYSSIDFFNPQKPGRHQRCTNTVVIFMVNDHFKGLSACGAGLIIIATHLFQVPTNLTGFLFP